MKNIERVSFTIEAASLGKFGAAYLLQDMANAMKAEGPQRCIGANEKFNLDANSSDEAVDQSRGKIDGYNYHRSQLDYKRTQLEPHHIELARAALSFLTPRPGSVYEVAEVSELQDPKPETFTSHAIFWETIDDETLRVAAFEEPGYAEMPHREKTFARMLLYEGLGHNARMLRPGRAVLCDVIVDDIN